MANSFSAYNMTTKNNTTLIQFQQRSPILHKVIRIHDLKQNSYLFHNNFAVYHWERVPQSQIWGCIRSDSLGCRHCEHAENPRGWQFLHIQTPRRAKKSHAEVKPGAKHPPCSGQPLERRANAERRGCHADW